MGSEPLYDDLIERVAELEQEVATLRESQELFRQVAENIRDVFFCEGYQNKSDHLCEPGL